MSNYYVANEDYELGCADSLMADVDLSGCSPACFTLIKTNNVKASGKNCLASIILSVTPATGTIKTSLIDGSAVTFVSATGAINGSSRAKSNHQSMLLADDTITGATVSTYTGGGSTGTLTVVGTNTQSGATVTDVCNVWIKKAGQKKFKVV